MDGAHGSALHGAGARLAARPIRILPVNQRTCHVRWVPCHHCMARPQVADGGDALQFWRAAANILNKQSRTADKGWSSSLGVGRGANNCSP
jgi:hypothetical protein